MNQSDLSEDICQFLDAAVQAAEVLSRKTNLPLDHSHVESALVLELNLASSVDLLERHLDKDRICSILANFNFKRLFQSCWMSFTLMNRSSRTDCRASLQKSPCALTESSGGFIKTMTTPSPQIRMLTT